MGADGVGLCLVGAHPRDPRSQQHPRITQGCDRLALRDWRDNRIMPSAFQPADPSRIAFVSERFATHAVAPRPREKEVTGQGRQRGSVRDRERLDKAPRRSENLPVCWETRTGLDRVRNGFEMEDSALRQAALCRSHIAPVCAVEIRWTPSCWPCTPTPVSCGTCRSGRP